MEIGFKEQATVVESAHNRAPYCHLEGAEIYIIPYMYANCLLTIDYHKPVIKCYYVPFLSKHHSNPPNLGE